MNKEFTSGYKKAVDSLPFLYKDEYMIIPNNTSKEPALATGATTGTVSGLAFLVLYFFPDLLNSRQTDLVLVIAGFAIPLLTAIFTRGFVWSPKSVQDILDKSIEDANARIDKKPIRGSDESLG